MDKITLKNKILILVFGIMLGAGAIFGGFILSHKSYENNLKATQKQSDDAQTKLKLSEQKVAELKEQVTAKDKALKENGPNSYQDLKATAIKFFEIYYDYDQEKVTNKERQTKVESLSTGRVYEDMFPLSADEIQSDYGYIQSSLDNLNVYPTGLNGKEITALIDVSYNVKAGELSSTISHYMWTVTFDTSTNKISQIEDLGRLSTDSKNN